jgi:hypothetical protein
VGGLLADDLQVSGRAEVKLVEQEVVGMDCLQAQRLRCGGWKVLSVRGDDTLRTAPDCRCNHVPVVRVW